MALELRMPPRSTTSQHWRTPLFEAMHFVVDHANAIYDRFAPPLSPNHGDLLRESMRLLNDPALALKEEFFVRHKVADEYSRDRLMLLFEMSARHRPRSPVAPGSSTTSVAWRDGSHYAGRRGPSNCRRVRRQYRAGTVGASPRIQSDRRETGDAATLYLSLKTREARGRI